MAGRLTLDVMPVGQGTRPVGGMRRRVALALLTAVVAALHLGGFNQFLEDRVGWGSNPQPQMRRMDVAYVRDLAPQAPAPVVMPPPPPPAAPRARKAAPAPAPSASQARAEAPAEPTPDVVPAPAPDAARMAEEAASAAAAAALAQSAASAASAATVAAMPASAAGTSVVSGQVNAGAFDWPPSTRLSYELRGNYRGEVQGSAQVEWIRAGTRYQVHVEALVGPSFAPLMARRVHSEGELTAEGLAPQRFEGEQRVAFSTRRWAMRFEPERVVLANGREVPPQPGMQDEASQFVQLAWLFTVRPDMLAVGRSVEMPLVLPQRLNRWVYDAVDEETLQLPFGPLATVHLKPRAGNARPGDFVVEMWFAPTLQYLPVRLLIRQDAQTYIDLLLKRAPEQAAR